MIARTHDLAAITGLGIAVLIVPIDSISLSTVLIALFANQVGGIFPDIDQSTAPFWRNLPIGNIFGRMASKMLGGHRFLTHSIIGLILAGLLLQLVLAFLHPIMPNVNSGYVWWAFMIGMFSHLVMDSFTKEGVPWLLPIPVKFGIPPMKSLRITAGKKIEYFIVFPGLVLFNVWLYAVYYQDLLATLHEHIV